MPKHREKSSHRKKVGDADEAVDESLEMSWEESMSTIGERIRHSFMKDDELADVTFIVGTGKVRVPGHKTILSLSSPVFRAQFYGPLSRMNEEGQGPTLVEIPDMEPEIFINFMSFLYRDELTDGTKGTAEDYLELLYPANKYLVPALSRLCVQELRDKIEPENVFQVYETALLYGEVKLKNWCLRYMNRVSKKIIELPQFLNLHPSRLSVFLESDGLAASEPEIHRAVLRWAEAKVSRHGEKKSQESMRNALGDLIYLIRFPTMSAMEFSQEEQNNVLVREEIIEIHRQIHCKETSTDSQFGTKKRRLDCQVYVARCCPVESLEPLNVLYVEEPPYKLIQFKIRTDKRIFLRGVSIFSILRYRASPKDSANFKVGLTVQVGDLPSVSKAKQFDGDAVVAVNKTFRRRSFGFPKIFAVDLDEASEVPANCIVAIRVEVFKACHPKMNLQTCLEPIGDLKCPHHKQVQVNCAVDDRKVTFEFLTPDELGVRSDEQIPGISFSL